MTIEMSKPKRILFYIAIMLCNIAVMGEMVIMPLTYNLYNAFPENLGAVNFMVSGPVLIMAIASFAASALCRKLSKKNIIIIGGIIFLMGSVFGIMIENIPFIIFTRCLMGIGEAFVNVGAMAMIAEVYVDENKRATFMGIYNAVMSGIGALMSALAGILAATAWQNAYRTYWLAIPMLAAMILFLPSIKPQASEAYENAHGGKKESIGIRFWLMLVTFIIFNFIYSIPTFYMSVYIIESGIGNVTFAGMFSAIATIGGVFMGLIFGFIYKKLGRKTSLIGFAGMLIAVSLIYFVPSSTSIIIAAILIGCSYATVFAFTYTQAPAVVPVSRIDDAIGIVSAAYAIAMFGTTFIITWVMSVMNSELVGPTFIIPVVLSAFILIFEFIVTAKEKPLGEATEII